MPCTSIDVRSLVTTLRIVFRKRRDGEALKSRSEIRLSWNKKSRKKEQGDKALL
jgi:hypothetical protein